jgi:hypothetical protein
MQLRIIGADERLREPRGVTILFLGETGVGKTSQVRTLPPERTVLIECECGDLSIRDFPVPMIRPMDWSDARDLACRIGGPNKSFPPTACYSPTHFEAVGGRLENLDQYQNIVVDSLTAILRLSFRHAEQQPEAYSERTGRKDLRGAYGLHAREAILWLNQLQSARTKNVIFIGILERVVDELRHVEWQLQAEGSKTSREIPAIVDQIVTYQFLDFGDGQPPIRGFVCRNPNQWGYPAKDRSGRLETIEEPDLGKLLRKLTNQHEPPKGENP